MPHPNHIERFRAKAEAYVAHQREVRAAWRQRNALSGLGMDSPRVDTAEAVMERLAREEARLEAFAKTPEGRFLDAAVKIANATGDERLLQCRSRGLDTNADFAARLLSGMSGPMADQAREALADFVAVHTKAAA